MNHLLNAALLLACVAAYSSIFQHSVSAHSHHSAPDDFTDSDAAGEHLAFMRRAPGSRHSSHSIDAELRAALGGHQVLLDRSRHAAGAAGAAERVLKRTHTSWGWKPRGRRSVEKALSEAMEWKRLAEVRQSINSHTYPATRPYAHSVRIDFDTNPFLSWSQLVDLRDWIVNRH